MINKDGPPLALLVRGLAAMIGILGLISLGTKDWVGFALSILTVVFILWVAKGLQEL